MIAVVQAKCPSCQHLLRIPNDWVNQPIRCKHCRQMFQSRRKVSTPVPVATLLSPSFGFENGPPPANQVPAAPAMPFVDEPMAAPAVQSSPAPVAPVPAAPVPATPAVMPAAPHVAPVTAVQPAMPVQMPQVPVGPVAQYGFNPYGFQPYNAAFDFDQAGMATPQAGMAPEATAPAPAKKPAKKNHWWKPAALAGVALIIMVAVLVAAGGNLSGIFTPKKKSDTSSTQTAKATPPDVSEPPAKKNTPPEPPKSKQPANNPPKSNTPSEPPIEPKNPPKTVEPKTGTGEPKTGTLPPKVSPKNPAPEYLPRRALLVSVNNYLFANSLHYGSPQVDKGLPYPGSSTGVLARQMLLPPMKMPGTQVIELSDGSYPTLNLGLDPDVKQYNRKTHTTVKNVIETTIVDFLVHTRPQDRIILLFTGHAIDGENEAYLVPLEGDLQDTKTLIPLSWLYDQLAKVKARQKLLILDVCRFPPARGLELPAGGPMGEILDTKLQNPPPGVQVWSSCVKEQQSIEFEKGSLFLQALCAALQQRFPGILEPEDPFPLDELVVRVNQYMKAQLDSQKMTQVSRLTGMPPADGAPYDPAAPLPNQLVLRPPLPPAGGQVAGAALVDRMLDEIDSIPPVRAANRSAQKTLLNSEYLPPFAAAALEPFKSDMSFEAAAKADPAQYPLRVAILEAIKTLDDNAKFVMRETLANPGGPIAPKVKEEFLKAQEDPGVAVFELERALGKLQEAGKQRDKEMSKRWQAHYDYTLARLLSRIVYTYEYNFMLAQVRSDSLPPLEAGVHNGWRIGSRDRPQIREDKVRNYTRTIRTIWDRIKEEYPNTPWELFAKRESLIALGLEWRPSRD